MRPRLRARRFTEYQGRNLEDFALEAARPAGPKVADANRAELIEIVRRIQAGDLGTDYYLLLLRANTPHPRAADLIFHPVGLGNSNLAIETQWPLPSFSFESIAGC